MADDESKDSRDAYNALKELNIDPYEALDISSEATETEIRKAYRRGALKYHPDKNAGNEEALAKFHALERSYVVLSDPVTKGRVDITRNAQREKAEREAAFEGRRRQMKDDLERRESGAFKRKRDDLDAEELRRRELQRIAEDGRRRRQQRDDEQKREAAVQNAPVEIDINMDRPTSTATHRGTGVSELDRTVKVRFSRQGLAVSMDKDRLSALFGRFGTVESAFMSKDKRQRLHESDEKTLIGTGFVVFASVVGAHAAVEDIKQIFDPDYTQFEKVFWASGQEPDFMRRSNHVPASPAEVNSTATSTPVAAPPATPRSARPRHEIPGMTGTPTTPLPGGSGLRKVPSFASFSSATGGTPKTHTPSNLSFQSPSLEESTMIRLKMAEKRRLEKEIRQSEAESEQAV